MDACSWKESGTKDFSTPYYIKLSMHVNVKHPSQGEELADADSCFKQPIFRKKKR